MGGIHESQFIATDSIIIGSKAESKAYSLWISYRILKRDTVRGGIFFPEKGVFQGHAVSFTDSAISGKSAGQAIVAGDGSIFHGCYITDGDVNMKNTVLFGHIWARSIVTVKDDIGYTNWIIGCALKPLDRPVPFPLLGELPARVWMVSE
jgi:carbonic anhydrase/acetyltransferase-like protein (isoleucine patch superfamily)